MDALRNQRYPAALTLLSAGIVGLGLLLKPEPRRAQQPVISESEMARLQRLAHRRTLQDLRSYFAGVAEEVSHHVVRLDRASAIIWDASRMVTAGPLEPRTEALNVRQSGAMVSQTALSASPPNLPLAVLPVGPGSRPVERARREDLAPGDPILVVWRAADTRHLFAPGAFIGTNQAQCGDLKVREVQVNVSLREEMLGAGVFDVDGGLAAVVLRCDAGYAAVAGTGVDSVLKLVETPAERLLDGYGIHVKALDEAHRACLRVPAGALVSDVWKTRPAAWAGLLPGDVITAADGVPIVSARQFIAVAQPVPGRILDLIVRRGRKTLRIPVSAGSRREQPPGLGLALGPAPGYSVAEVEPGSPAGRSGIRPGDRILSIDGRLPSNASVAQRALSRRSGSPAYLVVERGARQFGVLLG